MTRSAPARRERGGRADVAAPARRHVRRVGAQRVAARRAGKRRSDSPRRADSAPRRSRRRRCRRGRTARAMRPRARAIRAASRATASPARSIRTSAGTPAAMAKRSARPISRGVSSSGHSASAIIGSGSWRRRVRAARAWTPRAGRAILRENERSAHASRIPHRPYRAERARPRRQRRLLRRRARPQGDREQDRPADDPLVRVRRQPRDPSHHRPRRAAAGAAAVSAFLPVDAAFRRDAGLSQGARRALQRRLRRADDLQPARRRRAPNLFPGPRQLLGRGLRGEPDGTVG